MSYDAPYEGLKVVDLSQGVAGPYCGMLLAQHGADVIKVEPGGDGDWARTIGTPYGGHSAYSLPANVGKRSIALDLKSQRGKDVLWRLIEGADVLIEGYRPGVLARLGFGYEAVSAREPRILYHSVSGFGQTGPLADRPAMDPVLQAFTGLMMDNKGEDGIPHRLQFIAIDMATGLYGFQALSAALFARQRETRGRRLTVSLLESAAALQVVRMMMVTLEGPQARRAMPSGVFQTADGWLQLLVVRDAQWIGLANALERPDLAADPRFATPQSRVENQNELLAAIRPVFAARPTDHWTPLLRKADVMHERLNNLEQFFEQPQTKAIDLISWTTMPGDATPIPMPNLPAMPKFVPGTPLATSPLVGENTREILGEHGYSGAEIDALLAERIIEINAR